MATKPFHLQDNYTSGGYVSAKDLDRRASVIRTQLGGLLKTIGEGVSIAPPYSDSSLSVTVASSTVTVDPGLGFIEDSLGNIFVFEFITPQSLVLPQDDPVYIHAQYIEPDADVADPDVAPTEDTENSGKVLLVADPSDVVSEAILLAEVSNGIVTDKRTLVRWDKNTASIINLLLWLGYDSNAYDTDGTVSDRLDALETDDGSGGNGITYIAPAKWSVDDPRATSDVIADLIAAAVGDTSSQTPIPMQLPEDRLGEALMHTRDGVIRLDPAVADAIEAAELVAGFAGHAADGSPPPADGINDTDNVLLYSTLQVDTPNRELTP